MSGSYLCSIFPTWWMEESPLPTQNLLISCYFKKSPSSGIAILPHPRLISSPPSHFVLILYSMDTQVMLILILNGVQYSQKAIFSFEKDSNGQTHSSSGFHHLEINFPTAKFHWVGISLRPIAAI